MRKVYMSLTRIETIKGIQFFERSKGAFGNYETIRHMKDLIRTSVKEDTTLQDFVVQRILSPNNLDSHSDVKKIINAIHQFVIKNVRYVSDGAGQLEALKSARETLRRGYGDCDDLVVLEASLLGVIGIPSSIIAAKYEARTDGFDHVFLAADTKTGVIPLEPTVRPSKAGFYVNRVLDYRVIPVFPEDWQDRTENVGYVTRSVLRGLSRILGTLSPLTAFVVPEFAAAQAVKQTGDSLQGLIKRS